MSENLPASAKQHFTHLGHFFVVLIFRRVAVVVTALTQGAQIYQASGGVGGGHVLICSVLCCVVTRAKEVTSRKNLFFAASAT